MKKCTCECHLRYKNGPILFSKHTYILSNVMLKLISTQFLEFSGILWPIPCLNSKTFSGPKYPLPFLPRV